MKYKKLLLLLSVLIVFEIIQMGVGSAVECNTTNNVINSTSISNGCTLSYSGTYIMSGESFYFNGSSNGVIQLKGSNIILDGNGSILIGNFTAGSATFYAGIRSFNNSNTIKNLKIHDYYNNIFVGSGINSSYIVNNSFNLGNRLVQISGDNWIVENNTFSNQSTTAGLYSVGTGIKNVTIMGNLFLNQKVTGYQLQLGSKLSNAIIQRNIFKDSIQNSININSDGNGVPSNISILDNIFNNSNAQAIFLSNNTNVNVTGNSFNNVTRGVIANNLNLLLIDYNNYSNDLVSVSDQFLLTNVTNVQIRNNNIYGTNEIYQSAFGFLGSGGNISIINNYWDSSQYGVVFYNPDFNNINISYNTADFSDMGLGWIQGNNIDIGYNNISNSSISLDSYNIGLKLQGSNNVRIFNNNLTLMSSGGLVILNSTLVNITNNSFAFGSQNLRLSGGLPVNDGRIAGCAIMSIELFKSWLGGSYEISANDNITYITKFKSSDILINGNQFDSNTQCFLQGDGLVNLTHDFSNYWSVKFQTPTYLKDITQYFNSNLYKNISSFYASGQYATLYSTYYGSDSRKINYLIDKEYLWFNNTNSTQTYQTNIYDQANSLIYFSNGSVACSNINSCDGNINITLSPSNYSYVLDNFNLTESISRQNSPLWFSSSTSTEKHIASNLTQSINATVVTDIGDCTTKNLLTYTTDSGVKTTWRGDNAKTICEQLKTTGVVLTIEPAENSNELAWEDGSTDLSNKILKILIGFLALAVMIFAVAGFMIYAKDNFQNISVTKFTEYSVLLLLFTIMIIILINYIADVI